jgi:phosphoribosylaminoimidazole-succinocarboxamide synthase
VTAVLRGKVRDVHDVGNDRLVMVTSDRISAYDVILPTLIPGKGQVLTGLAAHWFAKTESVVPNHLLSVRRSDLPQEWRDPEFAGRTMLVKRLEMLPVECVVRGYLAGSGWRDYEETGAVSGHPLPTGLHLAQALPTPVFTPATKASTGHDENISREEVADLVGGHVAAEIERISIALYVLAARACRDVGIILADTKFEIGRDQDGRLVLADEAITPDSSRFWPADMYSAGANPPSFDKQFVRDWLDSSGWDHRPPAPPLPPDVVSGTRDRYREAYERITDRTLESWIEETER